MCGDRVEARAQDARIDDAVLEYSVEQPQDSVAGDRFFFCQKRAIPAHPTTASTRSS